MTHPSDLPESDVFKGLEWLSERIGYPVETVRGDTYPITWAADGELYASAGDPLWGAGFPFQPEHRNDPRYHGLDVEKFSGMAPDYRIDKTSEMLDYVGWGGEGPKPSGMISVGGSLYLAAQNLLGKKPAAHGDKSQHGSDAFIARSDDFGRTWAPTVADYLKRGAMFPGSPFGGPAFVQYGRDQAAPDGFVYAVSGDQWDNGSELRVGRVRADRILDAASWEFVAAVDKSNRPRWSKRLADAAAVLTLDRHLSLPEMVRLPGNGPSERRSASGSPCGGRYLLATWQLGADFSPEDGCELTVLESPEPWGPFRRVHVEDWTTGYPVFYCPRVPLKWFDPATREGWMLWSGSWASTRATDTERQYYRAQVRKFRLK